jgi:hypothetical protein
MKKLLLLTLFATFLVGCASGAKFENMAYTDSSGLTYDKNIKKSVGLSAVNGGSETNPLWTSEISSDAYREAVKLSLSTAGLFSENGRYQLTVTLLNVDQPMFGLDLKVTTIVSYVLTDTKTNKVLLNDTVTAIHTATFGDAAIAIKRLRLANEGSGRANIKVLLEKLSILNVSPNEVSLSGMGKK